MRLSELAERLGCRLEGDGDIDIVRVAGLEQAGPGDVTFVSNPKYRSRLSATRASAAILGPLSGEDPPAPCAVLRSDEPYVAFAHAVRMFARGAAPGRGIDRLSAIAPDAIIGSDASIGPFVTIGAGASIGARATIYPSVVIGAGARIGDDCVLHAGVSIREAVIIGHRVTVLDGAVIGSDGFGFAKQSDGTHVKIPQHADVVIEDDVEIGANCAIDRATIGETRIGKGVKLDNLIQIAHNVVISENTVIAAQSGVSGSTKVGKNCSLGGQVGLTGHIQIADHTKIGAQSGVGKSITESGKTYFGYPAREVRETLRIEAALVQLPALVGQVRELTNRVQELEKSLRPRKTRRKK